MIQRKNRFVAIISLLLVLGFSATSLVGYYVANESLQAHIRSNTLPLTSDNIYSEIQRDVLPSIVISSLMAQDTFVRNWILAGEKNPDQIINYLKSVQNRYDMATAFFVSENSSNYYHSTGILKRVNVDDPEDNWYFRNSKLKDDFEINVDLDTADRKRTNVFVNHKVHDFEGNYLGVIGVGLSSKVVMEMINLYQARYGRQVYFIDTTGKVVLQAEDSKAVDNIRQIEGISDIATQILTSPGGSYIYERDGSEVFLQARFVSELDWYLLVEEEGKTETNIQNTLWINLALSLVITGIVLLVANLTIGRYQQRLEIMATKDKLTGVDNRHAFESHFEQALKLADRRRKPLSLMLVDIDNFKQVNDTYGHLSGDAVIAGVASRLKAKLRFSDLICRWGGEEFLIILPDCDRDDACAIAEKIRQSIEMEKVLADGRDIFVTASFGISFYVNKEPKSELFKRADEALFSAKNLGRNRVEVS